MISSDENSPIIVPISGTLDLHGFKPCEVKELVSEYIDECFRVGISSGRIIHGKGIGTLREIVHSILRTHSKVSNFQLGEMNSGGWGSTSFSLNIETNNNKLTQNHT